MEAVLRTIFARESKEITRSEVEAVHEFNGVLLRELCCRHGALHGTAMYLSLTSTDYRRLVVARDSLNDEGALPCAPGSDVDPRGTRSAGELRGEGRSA